MKAVRGTVKSSKPISLSKAAATLSDFVDSGVCSRLEITAYLRRASSAFDELNSFHSEIKVARKDQHSTPDGDHASRSRKKRKRSVVEAGDPEEIRGSYNANSLPKRRILPSGAKLVEDGRVPKLEAAINASGNMKSKKVSTSASPAEKLVEDGNAIGFDGSDEKRKRKKQKMEEIKDEKGIDFRMDLKKKVELVKRHEKEDKNKGTENGEVNHEKRTIMIKRKV